MSVKEAKFLPLVLWKSKFKLYGGPYHKRPGNIQGIKMAEEILAPCSIAIDTKDFSVPDVIDLQLGLYAGIALLIKNGSMYVGCMGGVGRTGLYMAAMAKIFHAADCYLNARERAMSEKRRRENQIPWHRMKEVMCGEDDIGTYFEKQYRRMLNNPVPGSEKPLSVFDPVKYVRDYYNGHAVETAQQKKYIEDLNVDDLARYLATLYRRGLVKKNLMS